MNSRCIEHLEEMSELSHQEHIHGVLFPELPIDFEIVGGEQRDHQLGHAWDCKKDDELRRAKTENKL